LNSEAPRARQLLNFAIAYGGSAALQKALGFAIFMWLAHSLPVEQYAAFGLLYALQTGIAALAGAGIVESLIGTFQGRATIDRSTGMFGAANFTFILMAIPAILLAAALYAVFLPAAGAALWLPVSIIAGGLLTAFAALQANLVRLEERHIESLALSFFVPLGGYLGGGLAFHLHGDLASFFHGTALGLAVAALGLALSRVGAYGIGHSRDNVHALLSRVAPFIGIAVLMWAAGYGNTYLVESLFSADEVARFTFAFTLSAVMQLVATSLNQVWAPRFYRLVAELPLAALEARNRRFFAFQGAALGAVGAFMLVVLPWALGMVGGNLVAYRDLTVELLLLFLAYAVTIPWWHAQNYFYANNHGRQLMNVTIVGGVVGLAAWLAAAFAFGTIGIYVGFLLQMLARSVAVFVAARRHWGVSLQWEGIVLSSVLLGAGALLSLAIY
jgi:O-antigen/teichoic acid export membrane protein